MNKILLIGASGFVGTRLIDLIKNKSQIINLDKKQSLDYPSITTIGDIRNLNDIEKVTSDIDIVVHLAAEHRDDVSPTSLYYDVNVQGTKNVLKAMDKNNVRRIIFISSVAVYGLNKKNPDEKHLADPFNHYGKSKWEAEEVLRKWYMADKENRSLTIIRPTVIFGERNRGNVYNLLNQIASGKFIMIGKGENYKSMAYVGNVAAFIQFQLEKNTAGYHLYNYVDKPDFNMKDLVSQVEKSLQRKIPSNGIPFFIGMIGGYCFDVLSFISRKKFSISSVRVKKFCATTQFGAEAAHSNGFKAPFTLAEGLHKTLSYEFLNSDQ